MTRYLEDYESYIKLLMHMNGDDNGTVFTDETGKTVTRYNAVTKTGTKYLGSASGYFDGNGDYLSVPDSEDFNIGTADFTVSLWVNLISVYSGGYGMLLCEGTTENFFIAVDKGDGTNYKFRYYDLSVGAKVSSITLSLNTWIHLAAIRTNGNLQLYVNGVSGFSGSMDTSINWNALQIGRDPTDSRFYFNGYLDEFAIWKGVAIPISELYPMDQEIGSELGDSNNFGGVSLGSANMMEV